MSDEVPRIMAVDDSNKWYVRTRGKVLGPFSWAQLESMRDRGQISRFHELSQDRRDWIPAGDLADLFAPGNAPPGGRGAGRGDPYDVRDEARTPPASGDADPAAWFHARGGASVGPFRIQDLRAQASRGEIDATTPVWKDGMAGWAPARDVPELASLFAAAAPLATSQPHPAVTGPPRTSALAVASLVLGLLWLCGLGSLLAVIFGGVSLSQISRSRGALEGRGMAIAGLILGIIGLSLIALSIWLHGFFFFGLLDAGRQQELRRIRGF